MNKLKRFLALVLAMSMMLTAVPFGVFAAEAPTTNLSTTGSPFQAGTGGSNSFRIPAMVTLSDGTLVAAADARWNTTYDGGGLDTMVAVSADNGATWTHSFANYLGDNSNSYNYNSTCFIDPSLAVKKANGVETIYMLCDLYPYGVALNGSHLNGNPQFTTPKYDTGFNADGKLLLSNDDYASYGYYLDGTVIRSTDGTEVAGYTVDGHFNIKSTDGSVDTNLFFSDSPYKVARTGYLYLTKSTDKGATWSAPQLLPLKNGNEMVCLVGPGRGLVTYDGTIMFPVYSYNGEDAKYTALVYSKDNGATWTRTANFDKEISSEAALVELTSGAIRVFFRNENSELTYTDYIQGLGFGDAVTTGVKVNSDTQLSAISYSKTVNGNQVILVSAPAGPNAAGSNDNNGAYRSSGKIFCGIADGSANLRTMTWKTGSVAVTPVATGAPSGSTFTAEQGFFAYSCLTERKDNSVSILYEDSQQGWGENCSYTMAYKTYTESDLQKAFGVTFDGNTPEEGGEVDPNAVQVTLKVGQTTKVTDSTGAYVATTVPNANIVDMKLTTVAGNTEASVSSTKATALEDGATYIIRVFDTNYALSSDAGRGDWGTNTLAFQSNTLTAEQRHMWTLEKAEGGYKLKNANGYLNLGAANNSAYLNETGEVFTFAATDTGWTICNQSGRYINALGGLTTYYSAGGYTGDGTRFDLYKVTPASNGSTEITFTGVGAGKTTAVVGNTTYSITVEALNTVDVTMKVGDTATYTINGVALNGNHSDDVADVTWTAAADNTTVTVAKGQLLSDSSKVDISKCLFTFTDHAEEGYYVIESASVARKYLNNIMRDTSTTMPISATPGKVAITLGHTDMFQFKFNAVTGSTYDGTPSLHFHTELATPKWNRCGNDTSAKCYEYLYRAAEAGEKSSEEIPGYVRVTSTDEIDSGDQFLIAHTNGTNYYVLYPGTTETSCIAQVVTETTTVSEDSTTVTIKGKAAGSTKVTVGETVYNITVIPANVEKTENVTLNVGQTLEYIDNSGAYTTATVDPDGKIVEMTLTDATVAGEKKLVEITSLDQFVSGKSYFITSRNGQHVLTDETYSSTSLKVGDVVSTESTELWTFTGTYSGDNGSYTISRNGKYLNIANGSITMGTNAQELKIYRETYNGETHWIISDGNNNALNNFGQNNVQAGEWDPDAGGLWRIYELVEEPATAATKVSFTGKATGTTTAVVGNTLYNITVSGMTVDIELEVGETFTYTDTTGVYGDADITTRPDETRATMALTTTSNSVTKKLVQLTSSSFETGKRYVIENVQAKTNQPAKSVLTSSEATYTLTGLDMNGPLDVASSQTWTLTPSDNMYLISRNGEYVNIADQHATMERTSQELTFRYVEGSGWLIYVDADTDIYLCDLMGTNSGEAFGTTNADDTGNYWNIYEVVEEKNIDSTKVTFTGVAEGNTTAVVGGTVYNITVVPAETDDEVMNSATNTWTVDAEVQWQRYNALTGLHKDLYTDASWKPYEAARQAAYKQLVAITNSTYATEAEASAELAKATELVNALQTAYNNLVSAKTISVRYKLGDTVLDTREYKIASTDTSLTLPETIIVGDYIYEVTVDSLDLTGETGTGDTAYDVAVTLVGKVGGGFVGSQDIDLGYDHNNHIQVCDLVETDDAGTVTSRRKITEMTLTVGVSYDLDLATDTTGCTVEWSVEPTGVATVDQDGNVTAVAAGTTTLTAVIKDADGNVVEINSMPITVYPKGTGDRTTAMYIQEIDNTTVWCVVNGDTENRAFQVIEGELIYGQFDTTASDNSKTTAFSFFGDPDEAHALVYMKSTNSDDHYFLLHDDNGNLYDGTVTPNESYYVSGVTKGAGWWQAVGLNDNNQTNVAWRWQIVKDMVQWAILEGCDGGLGFTRRLSEGHMASNLTFASDPMPRIEKTVNGVLPTSRKQADFRRYTDGMVAAVHELVYFQITITQEVPTVWTDADETVGAITYSNAWVKDTVLPGAYLYTKELDNLDGTWDGEVAEAYRVQVEEITQKLNEAWTDEQKAAGVRTFPYYLLYEIQESDIPKFYIDNIAELSYGYKSHYSTGAQQGVADAEARISVVGTAIDDVVIDFGQSFVYEDHEYTSITDGKRYTFEGLTNTHLKGVYVDGENDEGILNADGTPRTTSHAEADYGTVEVKRFPTTDENGNTHDDKGYPLYKYVVTYTPTQILQDVDTVRLYGVGEGGREKVINAFRVYPATTVYYEEGFILNAASTWSSAGSAKATVNQTFELLGDSQFNEHGELTGKVSNKKHAYGYDPIYNGDGTDDVAKSSITSSTIGDKTSFTFTGNGFEIFADCTTSSGAVSVQVQNAAGKYVKIFNVNTIVAEENAASGDATDGQNVPLNSLPIVSWHTDTHGTYTVTVTKVVDTKPVTIDGVRIFNTVNERKYDNDDGTPNSPFAIDLEDEPEFYQLRDYVLHAIDVDENTTEDYTHKDGIDRLTEQIMGQISTDSEAPTAVVLAGGKYDGDAQNLLDNGPKNELYLHTGETLVFKVSTKRAMQIGLKAPHASTTYSLEYKVGEGENAPTTTVARNQALNTSVDLFYELGNPMGNEQTYTVTITNNGNELLSVTDLKICDDPNAAFVALNAADIKTALTVMGYSETCEDNHSYEDGFCTVCGIGSARNITTGVEYGTVGEALAEAQDGETVKLLTDCTEGNFMVAPGITLDLNGFKLTASYAVAMDSAHIVDSVGGGCLVIGMKALVLDEENAMVPVYNGEGYIFTQVGFVIREDTTHTGEGFKIKAMAYPLQMDVVELLKDGCADNNIQIVVTLRWDTEDGVGSQSFTYNEEFVKTVYSSNKGSWSSYGKAFTMILTGYENIENLTGYIAVTSGTDVQYFCETGVDIT